MFPSPAERVCTISSTEIGVLAVCSYKKDTFAFQLLKNGDYYVGEWDGKPAGSGVLFDLVIDTKHRHCGSHRIIPQEAGQRVTDFEPFWAQFNPYSGCRKPPANKEEHESPYNCPPDGRQTRYISGGSELIIGNFVAGHLNGFALNNTIGTNGILIGFFRNDVLEGEAIFVPFSLSRIVHGIWRGGKLVRTLASADLSAHEVNVPCVSAKH